ncbi:hypothetical protein DL766_008815 [Monosporascus sp. MC13-8B]|nr:hypothetical protein DL763_008824 [Monosporascus cannonballus]RYP17796.1 hypothetical protein DL766_008815 [Monosporascus sp. MC13-8B]
MSVPIFRRLAREVFKLSRRSQPSPRPLPSHEVRPFSSTVAPQYNFRSALREAASKSKPRPNPSRNRRRLGPLPVLAAGGGLLAFVAALLQPTTAPVPLEMRPEPTPSPCAERTPSDSDDGLPRYRISEVKQHGPGSERPWVMYEDKVYDITDWVGAHPGGEVILRAAGSSIEPYWNIFSIHKSPYVREILDQYLIGKIHPDDLVDGRPSQEYVEDPFETDPERDGRLRVITQKPCNAETPANELAESFLTPNEVFYVRNHMWVPVVEEARADDHTITIELPNGDVKSYTLRDLKARFKHHTVSAVLQCSGNRRKDMTEYARKTNGLQWTVGAISCAKWEGVRLRDVLADAGLSLDDPGDDAQHVQFSGLEAYGASIPMAPVLDPRGDVLLAFNMNDQPLPRDHGFPLRVIVPGHVAARCVKWVNKIVVSDEESQTQWQRRDYKCFGPNETSQDWDKYKSIQEMPVTSAITRARLKDIPRSHIRGALGQSGGQAKNSDGLEGQVVELEGYAYSGGGHGIQRVDVSLDGGKTWDQAKLLDDSKLEKGSKAWCWKRWRYEGTLPPATGTEPGEKRTTFVVKATDDAYNTQPEKYTDIYNLRGNLATAWHRVQFDCTGAVKSSKAPKNLGSSG